MAYQWQTVEEAAVSLGISTRTIARWIAQGKLQTRLEDGRREVFVGADAQTGPQSVKAAPVAEQTQTYAAYAQNVVEGEDVSQMDSPGSCHERDTVKDTALVLAEDRAYRAEMTLTVFHQSVTLATTEAHRARLNSRIAWGTVGAMAIAIVIAVGWTASKVTTARMQVEQLSGRIQMLSGDNEQALQQRDATAREREQYRQQLASTSQDKARMEGRMEELQSQAQLTAAQIKETQDQLRQAQEKLAALKPPATQPSTLAERIAGLMLAN